MRTIKFNNLVGTNTGNAVEIEVPDNFDENNTSFTKARDCGAAFGKQVAVVTNHLREVD